jgi:putative membrane protein
LSRWKIGAGLALLVGFALTAGMVLYVGVGSLEKAVRTVGWIGFLLYGLYSVLVFIPLGAAWWVVAPGSDARGPQSFIWSRLLREAASDVLPFSQVGGLVVGIRAMAAAGLGEAVIIASLIVDLTTEMAAQLIYTLFGVAMLVATLAHATGARDLISTTVLALVIGAAILGGFVVFQRRGLDFLGMLAGRWLKDTQARADAVQEVLKAIYARADRLGWSFLLHCFSWLASGAGSWLALGFMGSHLPLWKVLTLESLMSAVRSVAFMTPGGLGFQEGAYVLVAPLFGLPPESGLALSLLKRAKDIAIGVPALLVWQAGEGRRLMLKTRAGVVTAGGNPPPRPPCDASHPKSL